jgi:hypothetical protein
MWRVIVEMIGVLGGALGIATMLRQLIRNRRPPPSVSDDGKMYYGGMYSPENIDATIAKRAQYDAPPADKGIADDQERNR